MSERINSNTDEMDIFDAGAFNLFAILNANVADDGDTVDVIGEKLTDAMVPGAIVDFDPDEAEKAGAFTEDALSESDAAESTIDLNNIG